MPVWLMIASAAVLAAVLTLAADRMFLSRSAAPVSPTTPPDPTATPRPRVVVQIEPLPPQPTPSPLATDEHDRVLRQLQQDTTTQLNGMLILKAERQVTLAMEALLANNAAQADRELVAAQASLDEAFQIAPEDLKPQIRNERWIIGRVRADLEINPRDLDQELWRMRDRLLAMVGARQQGSS